MLQIIVEPSSDLPAPLMESSSAQPSAVIGIFIGGIVVITLLGIALYRVIKALRRPELHGTTREQIIKRWAEIEKTSVQGLMGAKLSVIEADKLLDQVLRSLFIPGQTLGERLKSAAYKYPNIHKVWGAHRLRNQLVHDTSFELTTRQARQALDDFKSALNVLNVL